MCCKYYVNSENTQKKKLLKNIYSLIKKTNLMCLKIFVVILKYFRVKNI